MKTGLVKVEIKGRKIVISFNILLLDKDKVVLGILFFRLNSLKNNIPKTTLSLSSSKILKEITIFLPLISTLTSPVFIYIILSLYSIGSPKIVTNGYKFSLSLYSNLIPLTVNS